MEEFTLTAETEEFSLSINQVDEHEFSLEFTFVVGSNGSSTIDGTPGNFVKIGDDNLPEDSGSKAADFETAGAAAAAVSAHLSAAPHNSALSEMTEDTTHRVVTDTEKSTWNGKQDALGFTPENSSNKKTSLTDSDTDYPTTKAVNTGLAGKMTKLPVATEYVVTVKDAGGDSYADIPTDDFWITNSTLIAALLDSGNWTGTTYSGTTTGAVEGQMYVGTTHLFIFKDSTFHRFAKV
jgi:hypothetical protein